MHRKTSAYIVLCFIIIASVGCSEKTNKLDSWLGDYNYNEPSIKAIAGYNMVMHWGLSVTRINDEYSAILNVSGQQTLLSFLCDVNGNDSVLFITYREILSGTKPDFHKGDTLFSFSRKNKTLSTTRWAAMQPMLDKHPPSECLCFRFTGTNQNNNRLSIP